MPPQIKLAEPEADRLLIAIIGPQNSGKTTSALRLATGITQVTGGKILVVDTERKRALRYAKHFTFNHMDLEAPYNPNKYDEYIKYAEENGYGKGDVIIIDSMSHEHDGPGGVLELHEKWLDDKAGQDFKKRDKMNMLAWNYAKKGRKHFITFTLEQARPHIILCFRAKDKVVMQKNDQTNKTEVVNNGLEPIGGPEYFFSMNISIVLPESSGGKPDWTEKSARVNEYGDGPLKQLLHNTQQISEETGKRLAQIEMAEISPNKPKIDLETAPEYVKKATTIKDKIAAALEVSTIDDIMTVDYKDDLEQVRLGKQETYDYLIRIAEQRKKQLLGDSS